MKVALLYGPDAECVDPLDTHQRPRRHYDVVEGDVIVIWREQIDPDSPDGHDDWHFVSDGVFEHVTIGTVKKIVKRLG